MSLLSLLRSFLRSSTSHPHGGIVLGGGTGGGGGAAPAPGALVGVNINNTIWFYQNTPLNDIWQGGSWYKDNSLMAAADLGADFYPHSQPGGTTLVKRVLQIPQVAGHFNVNWTGTGLGSLTLANATLVSGPTYVGSAGSAVINIPNVQADLTFLEPSIGYAITNPANYPHGFSVTAVGSVGQFNATFLAKIAATVAVGGFLRPMDWTGVNGNFGVSTSQLGSPAKVTAATRNTPTSGDWTNDNPGEGASSPYYTDGVPIEIGVAMANATNRNLHWPLHYNGSDDYYDAVATYAINNLNTGLTIAFELGNEVWNPSFLVQLQAKAEGIAEGLAQAEDGVTVPVNGPNERYVEKTIHIMDRIQVVWDAKAAPKASLRKAFGMQNAAGGSWATILLNYKPDGVRALKDHITHMMSAPYADINGGIDQTTNPFVAYTASQIIDQLITNTATPMANAAAIKAAAGALGVGYMSYEAGQETFFADASFAGTVARHAKMYDFTMNYLQQYELKVGTNALNWYMNTSPVSGSGAWGLDEYTGQTITLAATPKGKAVVDYNANIRKLFAPSGTLGIVGTNPTNGSLIGTVSRSVSGSVWSLSANDGGRMAIDQSGNVTVLDGTLLGAAGARSVTVRESDIRDPTGFIDTVKSYTVAVKYRYFKLHTTATVAGSGVALAEFEASASSGGASALLSKTVSATSEDFGAATNAVDGNTATFWASNFVSLPQDLIVDLGADSANWLAPFEFRIRARSGSQSNQAPGSFTIAGSTDGSGYTTLVTQAGQSFVSGESKTYLV